MIYFRFPVSGTTGSSGMRSGTTTESSTDGKCHCSPHKINKRKANIIVKKVGRFFFLFAKPNVCHTPACNFCSNKKICCIHGIQYTMHKTKKVNMWTCYRKSKLGPGKFVIWQVKWKPTVLTLRFSNCSNCYLFYGVLSNSVLPTLDKTFSDSPAEKFDRCWGIRLPP